MYYDTHCHLNSKEYDSDRVDVLERASTGNVKVIDIATNIDTSHKAIEFAKKHKGQLFPTVGYHPEEAAGINGWDEGINEDEISNIKNQLASLLKDNSVVGIGECGLDYFWLRKDEKYSADESEKIIKLQQQVFQIQCELAKEYNLPLVIHTRSNEEDSARIIDDALYILECSGSPNGIFHSFTGMYDQAERFLSKGYFISFNGIVTFKKSDEMRMLMKKCFEKYPNQILLETDGPYLSPEGIRGQRNEPVNVIMIYDVITTILGKDVQKLVAENANNLFNLYNN